MSISRLIRGQLELFNSFELWKKVLTVGISVVGSVLVSYGTYFWINYVQLNILPGYKKQQQKGEYEMSKQLRVRVIDLDGALLMQKEFMSRFSIELISLKDWGPYLRMDCSFRLFWGFERELSRAVGSTTDDAEQQKDGKIRPIITFFGSNDFHHLSLPLIRRFRTPFNLILFDNHPDWFKLYPGMHCGCWFSQAISLPTCQQAFHFGGDSYEFVDYWGLHPWKELKSGKLALFPVRKVWTGLQWGSVKQHVLRNDPVITENRVRLLLEPWKDVLRKYPLYITLDKDCMRKTDNYQNWNSGSLGRVEVLRILRVLLEYSGGNLLAMDVTGDFTEVSYHGFFRDYLHKTQHDDEQNKQDVDRALYTNQETNLNIMSLLNEHFEIKTNT